MLLSPHSLSPSLTLSLCISLSISLFCSMQILIYTLKNVFHKMKYDLKGHLAQLLYRVIYKKNSDLLIKLQP